jgi:chemotaxis protein methyltransferase CheR/type IV pilus assembly protein PilK
MQKDVAAHKWSLKSLPDMGEQQFSLWRELLETRTGIFVAEHRKSFLQTSLMQRMREVGITDYQKYYDQIVHDPMGNIEWAKLVDRLTVQETRFFRDPEAFDFVAKYIASHQTEYTKKNPLDIWSVGCSSGEEVYSLAMVASEILQVYHDEPSFLVTGTDISIPVLSKAKKAEYNPRRLETVSEHYVRHYFQQEPHGSFSITDKLKKKTCFAQVNILDLDKVAKTPRHIIYCQNVLIYFRRWRRQEILNHLVDRLAPGGLLLIGMGEVVDWKHEQLESIKGESITAFKKRA